MVKTSDRTRMALRSGVVRHDGISNAIVPRSNEPEATPQAKALYAVVAEPLTAAVNLKLEELAVEMEVDFIAGLLKERY